MSEFLDKLESKIDALDENERKKIIKKYQREIEEQMKDGKSEKEAVDELGNVDEIAKKICEDYHVNLVNRKKTLKETINSGIEASAKFLANTCEEVIDYSKSATKDNFLVTFFEILLKVVILIIVFMLLKVPFILVQSGVTFVFDLLFYPFNITLIELFEYIISVLYGAACIAASVYMFKGYFTKEVLPEKIPEEKEEPKEKKEVAKRNINYAVGIIKALIMIIVIIPMIFLNIIFLALTILAVFLIIKGVSVIGLAIILLSFFLLTLIMTTYLTDAMDNRDRNHLFALCISVISLIIGIVLFVDDLMGYNYPNTLDNCHFETTTESVTIDIEKETDFIFLEGNVEYVVDNNIKDNTVLLEVTYYEDFVDILLQRLIGEETDRLIISSQDKNLNADDYIFMYDNMIKDLQDNNIFNYSELDNYKILIYYNETTKELVK